MYCSVIYFCSYIHNLKRFRISLLMLSSIFLTFSSLKLFIIIYCKIKFINYFLKNKCPFYSLKKRLKKVILINYFHFVFFFYQQVFLLFCALRFGKFARQSKSAVIPRYEKFFYSMFYQQLSWSIRCTKMFTLGQHLSRDIRNSKI